MKIYISGSEDPEKRKQVKTALEKSGHEVIDRKDVEKQVEVLSTRGENAICMSLIAHCEAIFLIDGWQKSSMARREFNKAVKEKLTICFENGKTAKECVAE
ncbi:MAG: DUF4406 domain-containing protein [Lachnospiraceae bacterium]|nr:DUF4406 domain-containing protein [Lachnospiraceae bacterium]